MRLLHDHECWHVGLLVLDTLHDHCIVFHKEKGRWFFARALRSRIDRRGRRNLECLPPVDASALRSELALGMRLRDVWRAEVEETFEQIQHRTCKLSEWHSVRVVVLPSGTAAPSCRDVCVPWALMPDPLPIVELPDGGGLSKMDEILHEMHTLVHFHWADADAMQMQSRLMELTQRLQGALALRPTHESRSSNSNRATRLHCQRLHLLVPVPGPERRTHILDESCGGCGGGDHVASGCEL